MPRAKLHRKTASGKGELGFPVASTPTTPPPTTPPPNGEGRAPAYPTVVSTDLPATSWTTIFEDDFDSYAVTDAKWNINRFAYSPTSGYWTQDAAGMQVPPQTDAFEIKDSTAWIYATRKANPTGKPFVNAILSTERPQQSQTTPPKFVIPAGSTTYTEALLWNGKAQGTLSGFWLLGDTFSGDPVNVFGNPTVNPGVSGSTAGWPTGGEIDILEFVENNTGERYRPWSSLHWAADDNPDANPPYPGTWLNREFIGHPDSSATQRPELQDSWHTWGLYRSPFVMVVSIDGVELCRWNRFVGGGTSGARQGYERWPGAGVQFPAPIQWTGAMTLLLTYGIGGGWGGQGWTTAQLQDGKFGAKYVKVWGEA